MVKLLEQQSNLIGKGSHQSSSFLSWQLNKLLNAANISLCGVSFKYRVVKSVEWGLMMYGSVVLAWGLGGMGCEVWLAWVKRC